MESGEAGGEGVPNFEKQVRPEQRIGRVSIFSGKIELGGKNRAMRGLQAHVIMTRPARIQTRHDRLERVPAAGVRELMAAAANSSQVVFTLGICVPKVEESPANRLPKSRSPSRPTGRHNSQP